MFRKKGTHLKTRLDEHFDIDYIENQEVELWKRKNPAKYKYGDIVIFNNYDEGKFEGKIIDVLIFMPANFDFSRSYWIRVNNKTFEIDESCIIQKQ